MNLHNPYKSFPTKSVDVPIENAKRSTVRWAIGGMLIGAAGPLAYGAYGLYRESAYAASLPPGMGACGMGAFAALVVLIVGTPVCGMVGAFAGWLACKVRW